MESQVPPRQPANDAGKITEKPLARKQALQSETAQQAHFKMTAPAPYRTSMGHNEHISAEQFREAMSRLAASVNILTSDGPAGRVGVTVSSACSVSDQPPTVLVCLNRGTDVNETIKQNGVFSLNTLIHDHTSISDAFAGRGDLDMADRFGYGTWTTLETGSPVLEEARVVCDCRVSEIAEVGTHSVFFGEVVAAHFGGKEKALIYLDRNYHAL